jgi:hypothetical protein
MSDNTAPKMRDLQGANKIRFAQFMVLTANISLNWLVLWAFTAPTVTEVAEDAAEAVATNVFWNSWWWLINVVIAISMQIVLTWVPMFIREGSFYVKWRKYLQTADTVLNYVGLTILATMVMGIATGLDRMVREMLAAVDSFIKAFANLLDLEVMGTAVIILILSEGLRFLAVITELVPKQVPVAKQSGGGGNNQGGGGNGGQQQGKKD